MLEIIQPAKVISFTYFSEHSVEIIVSKNKQQLL